MPTGYTAYIEDGKITTGKDFLRLCTRAFGIALSIRDESLDVATPEHFEPDQYYHKQLLSVIKNLEEAKKMTIDSAREEMRRKRSEMISDSIKLEEKDVWNNKKYDSEYIAYVCRKFSLQPAQIVSEWKREFGSYSRFKNFLIK